MDYVEMTRKIEGLCADVRRLEDVQRIRENEILANILRRRVYDILEMREDITFDDALTIVRTILMENLTDKYIYDFDFTPQEPDYPEYSLE